MTASLRVFLVATVFALGAACWSGFTSSAQEKGKLGLDPQKWEYKFLQLTTDEKTDEKELNKLGDGGWELVTVVTTGPSHALSYRAIFKRMKR